MATEKQFDAVHCDTISLAPYKSIFPNTPSVLDHHNIESHMMLRRAENEPNLLKKLYFWQEGVKLERYEKNLCPTFSLNITCSDLDTVRLNDAVKGLHATNIPNGVDLEYFHTSSERKLNGKEKTRFVFVGRLNAYTNAKAAYFLADKLHPLIQEKFPDSETLLVGSGPHADLKRLANESSNLKVTDFVEDVRPYIEQSTLYLCPITDGGGTKLKILDALAMGIPLIANPIACEGIQVEDGVSVLFAETPSQYVEKIEFLLNNPELYDTLSKKGRQVVEENYSYLSIGKQLQGAFVDITH